MDAPYFPFYPADWLSDPNVQTLTLEESGAYITLLAYMWRDGKECTLPDDDKYLSRLLHVSPRKWSSLRKVLVDGTGAVFRKSEDGHLWNKRMEEERNAVQEKVEKNSKAAKVRWEKENHKRLQSKRNAYAMQTHSERISDAVQMQSKRNATEGASVTHMQNDAISDPESDPDPEKDQEREIIARTRACSEVVKAYEEICGAMRGDENHVHFLLDYLDDGLSAEVVIHALHKSSHADFPAKYAERILQGYAKDGLNTIDLVREKEQSKHESDRGNSQSNGRANRRESTRESPSISGTAGIIGRVPPLTN